MLVRIIATSLCAAVIAGALLRGEERNDWPVMVQHVDPTGVADAAQYAGPLVFTGKTDNDWHGFRPFYGNHKTGDQENSYFLYPFFSWQREPHFDSFSFFQLINLSHVTSDPGTVREKQTRGFDVWPFYFSRNTGSPETSYQAFVPFGGVIKNRFGDDRISFVLFPLYLRTEKAGKHTVNAPWPFLRFIGGAGNHGFEFWPLFGHSARAGDYDNQFYLWPLIYRSVTNLSAPQPDVKFGFLPFYSRDSRPGDFQENYLWPFFGYTHRTEPYHYNEQRYFWPFLVQGRGEAHFINRWAPFYTHSVMKGYDKTWVLWPLFRHAQWEDGGVDQQKNQVLWALYWSLTQRSLTNPAAAPAHKTHLWPLFSAWDNGAGRKQVQVLSPFEVFFPTNETVRHLYTPLFALYRYDRQDAATVRHTLLWNAVSYRRGPDSREFHFGPLFAQSRNPEQRRVTIGNGLLAWQRAATDSHWKFSLFDFGQKPAKVPVTPPSP